MLLVSGSMSHALSERGNPLTCQQSRTCGHGERGSLWSDCMSGVIAAEEPFSTHLIAQSTSREERVPLGRWDSFRKWKQILIIFVSLTCLDSYLLSLKATAGVSSVFAFLLLIQRFVHRLANPYLWRPTFTWGQTWGVTGQLQLRRRLDWLPRLLLCLKGCIPLPAWAQRWSCFCQLSKWKTCQTLWVESNV